MAGGGKRAGSGRKKGSVTRITREVAEKLIPQGITPLEVMLKTMRALWDKAQPVPVDEKTGLPGPIDLEAAKEAMVVADRAAPYCHARIASIEPVVPKPVEDELSVIEEARLVVFAIKMGAREVSKQRALPKPKKRVAA